MKTVSVDLVVVSGVLPLGGSTTFVLNLAKGRKTKERNLPVICMSEECPLEKEFVAAGVDLHKVSRKGRIMEDCVGATYGVLRELKPAAVLANLSSESFELLRMVPQGVLRIGIIHSDDPGPYRMAAQYAPWMDVIIGVSKKICETLRGMEEFARVRVEHISYGIAFEPEAGARDKGGSEVLRVIYLGRLIEEQKRVSRLAELIERSAAEKIPVQYTIAGSGPDEKEFLHKIAGLPHVRVLGHLPNHAVAAELRRQDVYILLSDYEGLPLSLLEAMGEGVVPVVPNMEGGICEVVGEESGIRLRETSASCALEELRRLAADAGLRRKLSEGAVRTVRGHYTAEAMAAKLQSLLGPSGLGQEWPEERVPHLLGLPGVLYSGPLRPLRRLLKKCGDGK